MYVTTLPTTKGRKERDDVGGIALGEALRPQERLDRKRIEAKMAALALPSGSDDPRVEAAKRASTTTCSSEYDEERPHEKSVAGKNGRSRRKSWNGAVAEPAWNRSLAHPDGRVGGGSQFFLGLLVESLDGSKAFVAGSVLSLTVWSVLCASFAGWLSGLADGGAPWAERLLEHMEGCSRGGGSAISIVGEDRMEGGMERERNLTCASHTFDLTSPPCNLCFSHNELLELSSRRYDIISQERCSCLP